MTMHNFIRSPFEVLKIGGKKFLDIRSNDMGNDSINKHGLGKRMAIKSKLGEVDRDFLVVSQQSI